MNLAWYIALKYFFSKRKYNAINIISGISLLSVITITIATVCVLSVMNGFETVIKNMCCQFDPEYKILPKYGKYLAVNNELITKLNNINNIEYVCQIVEEEALIRYKDFQTGAKIMGVDNNFPKMTNIDSLITDGHYSVFDGAFDRATLGRGLAHTIGTNAHFVDGIHIFAPKRTTKVNMINPLQNVISETVYIAGTFAVNQSKYDDEIICVSLQLARRLFELDSNTVSYLGIKLKKTSSPKIIKKNILNLFNNNVIIQNQYEQQEDFYKMTQVEKKMTTLLLLFILLIASFNIISSLYMVILDKEESIKIFYNLGMNNQSIKKIFFRQGWLISIFGGTIGVILGCGLCFLQQHFGWLKIGTGDNYVLSAYPVQVQIQDLILTLLAVWILGMIMAYIPTRHIRNNKNRINNK